MYCDVCATPISSPLMGEDEGEGDQIQLRPSLLLYPSVGREYGEKGGVFATMTDKESLNALSAGER